ncbi:hypothetical protein CQ12_16895 [Bradyrhizobium jicamae]|uniref:Uncharacterized protein n=1 Tax=Bradyrhizobium jicamae TaxID=280332 RepID=A0A0R3LM67_9BRAD|nr:hypothetical protein CQ12_16895 [Bradyrhizobium jicamae]
MMEIMKNPLYIANGVLLASFLVLVAAVLGVLFCRWMDASEEGRASQSRCVIHAWYLDQCEE